MTDFVDRLLGAPDAAAVRPRAPLPFEEGPVLAPAAAHSARPPAGAFRGRERAEGAEDEDAENVPDDEGLRAIGPRRGLGKLVEVEGEPQPDAGPGIARPVPAVVTEDDGAPARRLPPSAPPSTAVHVPAPAAKPRAAGRDADPVGRAPLRPSPAHGGDARRTAPRKPVAARPQSPGPADPADPPLDYSPSRPVGSHDEPWTSPVPARTAGRRRSPAPSPDPVVHITIGRLEVRAAPSAQPEPARERPKPRRTPAVPLEDYLRQRSGGTR